MVVGVEKEFVGNGDCGGWLMIFDKVLNDMELDIYKMQRRESMIPEVS